MSYLGTTKIGKMYLGSTEIAKAYLGNDIVFQKGSSTYSRLPDGYTELACVRCGNSGYTAAVNTGVAGAKDLEITVRFSFTSFVNYAPIYGNYIDENHLCNRAILTNSSGSLYVAGGDNLATSISGLRTYQTHTLTVTKTSASLEGTTTTISAASKTDNTNNIWLGSNGSSSPQSTINLRIFAFIIKKDGVTIRNYVPAKRDSDSAVGFYDLATNSFVTSSTSSEFIAGAEAEYSGNLLKCLHWKGENNLSGSSWLDSVTSQIWTVSNGTHGTDFYEFLNASPSTSSQYATMLGSLPDLGYHWKIVADIAIRTQANNPSSFVPIDFGGLGTVDSGKCSTYISLGSNGYWGVGAKFDGNSSSATYSGTGDYHIGKETITTSEEWIRRTVTIGVRASSVSGKDETFINVSGMGESKSATPYNPIRFNRWMTPMYIARALIASSSTYKYSTSTRIYSIKVYYEPII